jgi:HSP20 family protein
MTIFTMPLQASRTNSWLGRDLDHLFQESLRDVASANAALATAAADAPNWTPAADIIEDAGAVTITLDIPGVRADSLEVLSQDGVLTIRGERNATTRSEGARVVRSERATGRFTRRFRLSKSADVDNVAAEYVDGILTIRVAKAAPPQPRRVTVQVGSVPANTATVAPAVV